MSDLKEGARVEVPGYGTGTVYELTDEKTVRARFPDGRSARVDRRNLKPAPKDEGDSRTGSGVQDKMLRGPSVR